MDLSMPVTIVLIAVAVAMAVFCGWRGAQPWDIRKGPRMMPWRFLMLLGFTLAMMLLVHVVNLLGFVTGQNQPRY